MTATTADAGTVELRWPGGAATVSPLAGMLTDLRFDLPAGSFRPLAALARTDDAGLPAHLRALGGEFPCVPFGSAGPVDADGWPAAPADDPPHGPGADATWEVLEEGPEGVVLTCPYPDRSPVRRLVRRIRPLQGPAIAVDLVVEARRRARLPIGMHPILRLPDDGTLVLDVRFERGFTYPVQVHPSSPTAPGSRFDRLDAVPARDGGTVDLHRLPLGEPAEDVVLLAGARSPARVHVEAARADLVLEWDDRVLPSLLLWHSDRALAEPPWSGRYRGLGLEPVAAAFDLPSGVSAADNPVSRTGVPTAVELDPDHPLELSMVLRAEPAPPTADPTGQEGTSR